MVLQKILQILFLSMVIFIVVLAKYRTKRKIDLFKKYNISPFVWLYNRYKIMGITKPASFIKDKLKIEDVKEYQKIDLFLKVIWGAVLFLSLFLLVLVLGYRLQ